MTAGLSATCGWVNARPGQPGQGTEHRRGRPPDQRNQPTGHVQAGEADPMRGDRGDRAERPGRGRYQKRQQVRRARVVGVKSSRLASEEYGDSPATAGGAMMPATASTT